MASTQRVLVVANRTADSRELLAELERRATAGPIAVTLLVPQDVFSGRSRRLNAALTRLHGAGIPAQGMLGDVDPLIAVQDAWRADHYDEIVVSTLPAGESRWLGLDLPGRIAQATGAHVRHVIAVPVHDLEATTTH